jgi:hypothetical protein
MSSELTEQPGPASNPMLWLERAIEKGVDATTLGKLTDLVERWQANLAKTAFAVAMNACQKEMPRIVKDATNAHTNGKYVLLETLRDAITPIYLKHGFSLSWSQRESSKPGETIVLCTLYHVGGHSHVYEGAYPIDGQGAKGSGVMSALQGTVSAHTYAQRDMLRLMFDITIAGQDKDGQTDNLDPELVKEINGHLSRVNNVEEWLHWVNPAAESLADLTTLQAKNLLGELKRQASKRKAGAK